MIPDSTIYSSHFSYFMVLKLHENRFFKKIKVFVCKLDFMCYNTNIRAKGLIKDDST